MSTLIILVRNRGHVVKKDDFMREVWPDEFVEEGNLAQHIFILRRAFGDTADHPQYIETVPRQGYRFLGLVKEIHDACVPTEVAFVSQPAYSVAVLPFINRNPDPKIEHLSDSVSEGIINGLAQLPQIHVRPISTVFRYKHKDVDAQQIGRKLGVHSIVMGTVRVVDNMLMISTELIDVAGGWQVYGKSYKAKSNKVLRVQEQIVRDVIAALRLRSVEGRSTTDGIGDRTAGFQ